MMPESMPLTKTIAVVLSLVLFPCTAFAQVKGPGGEELSADLDNSIARGLAYLARQQQSDGSFQSREKGNDNNPRFSGPKVALTGLSLMAYLAAGRMPDTGKHGQTVRNATDYLIKVCPEDGYFGKVDGSRMYGHAIATLALAEAYGMEADATQRKRLRGALTRAVKVLLTAQNTKKDEHFAGGWRYEIASGDSDLSVTAWCILALRAAHNAGIEVPKDSADRAAAFVLRCWKPEQKAFAYQPGGEVSISMTAAAVLNLELLDRGSRQEVRAGMKFLNSRAIGDETEYPFYARYYVAQGAFQAGGTAWPDIWKQTQGKLLQQQKKEDGSWPQSRTASEPGKTYSTAISVLTLSIPLRLLPTYQR
jgi:hypothetical protein